jgi:hypothetical protein
MRIDAAFRRKAAIRENENWCLARPPMRRQNDEMANKKRKTDTVRVSRLGCMRKSTVEVDMTGKSVEHIELWTDEPTTQKNPLPKDDEASSGNREED